MFCSRAFLLNITMPIKKIKISELPLVESLKGLYTIGYKIIDGIKTSVKVSLEDIQTVYQDVVNAVKNLPISDKTTMSTNGTRPPKHTTRQTSTPKAMLSLSRRYMLQLLTWKPIRAIRILQKVILYW